MSHTLQIIVPDTLYETLTKTAQQTGQPLESIATKWLAVAAERFVALLTSPLRIPRPRVIDFITGIKNSPYIQVIHVDSTLDAQAWELLTQPPDKTWSLVDCTSFVVMQREGLTEALTTVHHFAQAGYLPLLR